MDKKFHFWPPGGQFLHLLYQILEEHAIRPIFHVLNISVAIMDQKLTKWLPGTMH